MKFTSLRAQTPQYRKWSPTANDPETANDPQNGPQMILDRKWSPNSTANDPERKVGMTWTEVSGSSCRFYYYYNKSDLKLNFTSKIDIWIKTKWKNHSSVKTKSVGNTRLSGLLPHAKMLLVPMTFFRLWRVDYTSEENGLPPFSYWEVMTRIFCGYCCFW